MNKDKVNVVTCKDCIYYPACNYTMWCDLFKDKTKFVEVVKCCDCIHGVKSDTNGYYICCAMTNPNYVPLNHFCSYGERKDRAGE